MHLGGSRGDNHQYDHVAIGTKDILMGRKVYTITQIPTTSTLLLQ